MLKKPSLLNMLKNYKFTVPENTRRDIHTTRKPLFPNWKHKKNTIFLRNIQENARKTKFAEKLKRNPPSSENVFPSQKLLKK